MFAAHRMVDRWRVTQCYQVADDGAGTVGTLPTSDEAIKKAAYERDAAKAEATKLRKEIEDIKRSLPTDEQKQRWADLEKVNETAEEERKRKAGEFDSWRTQISEKHTKELERKDKEKAEEQAKAAAIDKTLNDTLIGLAFAGAADLFGPTAKTVLLPKVAQAYFAGHVQVVIDEKTGERSVVVKDTHGTPIVDPKTGAPMDFARAMKEVIDAHPDRDHLLRGSGKVGSGNAGGANGGGTGVDFDHLKPADFRDPKIREALKRRQSAAGGLQIGPAWDRQDK